MASRQPWDNLRKDLSGRRKGKWKGPETGTGLVCVRKKTKGQEGGSKMVESDWREGWSGKIWPAHVGNCGLL